MLETINRKNLGSHFFDSLLERIGKTRVDVIDEPLWKAKWHISRTLYDSLRDDCIKQAKKTLKCNRTKASVAFEGFWEEFGVRIIG